MSFCEKSIVLNIFMYFKYIAIVLLIITLIFKRKNKNIIILNKISNALILFIVIYYLLFLIFYFTNFEIRKCFSNSNIFKITNYNYIDKSYKKENNISTTNSLITTMVPLDKKENLSGLKFSIYNQNQFPMNKYAFSLNNENTEYLFEKSGTEITTLSSVITSVTGEKVTPIDIIDYLNTKEYITKPLNLFELLNVMYEENDFVFSQIGPEFIDNSLKEGAVVVARVHGNKKGNIFTCSDSYIVIYDITGDKYSVMSANDKDHEIICSSNSKGFGNYVDKNINDKLYSYDEITTNSDYYYAIWR